VKVGDMVRRINTPYPELKKVCGIIVNAWSSVDSTCEVWWPNGEITIPFKKNIEVISESR
jgi:hypothetical protein